MKFRPRRTVVIASLLAFTCCAASHFGSREAAASAQAASDDASVGAAVDAYVNAEIDAEKIPGLALAVVRDGHVIKATGYGFANLELDVRVTPETIFQTGSVGKQFAAVGVMMLAEENKIALDDKLSKYLPNTPAKWRDVTIRHLLTHTSGIADYGGEIDSKPTVIDLRKDYTEAELLKQFTLLPMNFPPGTSWSYSNTGYVLLGFVIRKVTGEFYGDFLQQRIFQPLDMTSTRIISEADIVKNRSAGYELVNGEIKNQKWVAPVTQHHRRRRSLHHRARHGQVGRRALHRKAAEALELRSDLDARHAEAREKRWRHQLPIRLWLGHHQRRRPQTHRTQRLMARFHHANFPLR